MDLLQAVMEDNLEMVKAYINSGNPVNVTDKDGNCGLHLSKNIDIIRILLEAGITGDHRNRKLRTPLHILFTFSENSAKQNWKNIDNVLLNICLLFNEYGWVSPNTQDEDGRTILHNLFSFGSHFGLCLKQETLIEMMNIFMSNGGRVNIPDYEGRTPLHMTVGDGDIEITEMLFDYGADGNIQSYDGCTPLHLIYHLENERLLDSLLNRGCSPSVKDKNGQTVIHYAAG